MLQLWAQCILRYCHMFVDVHFSMRMFPSFHPRSTTVTFIQDGTSPSTPTRVVENPAGSGQYVRMCIGCLHDVISVYKMAHVS